MLYQGNAEEREEFFAQKKERAEQELRIVVIQLGAGTKPLILRLCFR